MVLDDIKDLIDGEHRQGKVLFSFEGSEWIQRGNRERMLLEGELPPIMVAGMGQSLVLWVCLLSTKAPFKRLVDGTLCSLLQLNVRLGPGQDFTHPRDVVLQQVLVKVRDLQSADECECGYIFTAIENFDKLAPEVVDVILEAVTLPHFDGEKVMVVLLSLPVGR